ncbi:G protein-coupled glucose receptor regulating Gpa2-domain-containing protein [Amylocarpus encephaloides]|uniref:G protein-coupled glucose receptor regulating Gpa2-domain-containing protein n=1 Tax=Amylocarpus encephaloides TaxID=45428 RepID=A0A9P7YQN0_9HELO|nr:G protein-coupled glucose receptor regulating Gpa2-domain-containing protein [Amylocarpus encephaloides]
MSTLNSLDTLDIESSSLSPLPDVLSHGLVAVSTFGLLSFFCSTSLFFYMTWRLITWHRYSGSEQPTNQFLLLIYNLLFADIQQACAFLLNIGALRNNAILVDQPLCFAQGWFVSTGDLASSVFISAIAVHTLFGVVRNYRLPTWAFYCAIGLCWFFIYLMAAIGPILHGKDFYVRAAAWCWINNRYSSERLWFHYFWIFVGMFSTIIIYSFIYLWLRRKQRQGLISKTAIRNATPLMILYPLIYTVCTAPLASLRIYALAGHSVSLGYFCMAGTMIACNGWLDVLLYASTRADIVFADLPPGEGTGLDTFNFMGRHMGVSPTVSHSSNRSNVDSRNDSRMALGRRSQDTESLEHLYGMGQIGVKGEVTVSVASLEDGSAGRSPMGNETTASAHASATWDLRSVKSATSMHAIG